MTYYTLAVRNDGVWSPQYGDWEKAQVESERDEMRREYFLKDLKILTSAPEQAAINAAIEGLNANG